MRKFLIIALAAALLISAGAFAYTYSTSTLSLNVLPPTSDVVTTNASATQPDWDAILDALTSSNQTAGEVPSGNIFTLSPHPAYSGDLLAKIYLTNTGNLTKAYNYLNIKVYLYGSSESSMTPNYRLLTLQNGVAALTLEDISGIFGAWTQTLASDFQSGNLTQVDATTSPNDVLLAQFSSNNTDPYSNETKIASKTNLTVGNGQVTLVAGGASGNETFRPNAAGDDTNVSFQYPASGAHWDKVDDSAPDDYATYIYTNNTSYQRDLYNVPNHSSGIGSIGNVTAYYRFANSASTKWGLVYRGPSDDGFLSTAEIGTTAQITDSLIDSLEWDIADGFEPDIINISGNIYAIAYRGTGSDGWLVTVEVDTTGNITGTVIDTLEWDIANGFEPDIIHISGDYYAIAYRGTASDGFIVTVTIDSSGNIGASVVDSFEFDPVNCLRPKILYITGDYYVVAYTGTDGDGWLATVTIDSSGNISAAITDSMEFDIASALEVDMIQISSDVFAIAYNGPGTDGWLATVQINSSGNITDTVIDTFEWDASNALTPRIIRISGNYYGIAYRGVGSDGWLVTVEIDSSGNITNSVIDSYEWDAADGFEPDFAHVAGNFYAIAYRTGVTNLCNLITLEIATNGQITNAIIDTLQFEATYGFTPQLIQVSGTPGSVYAKPAIKTYSTVYTGAEQTNATDTFADKSYQWTLNPNTGLAWTWSEIDAVQIGLELKADSAVDAAVATQVYLVVSYTAYNSPGTLLSINLLSGETVASTDNFTYTAPAIPSGTTLRAQFSTDNSTWYNSSGTLNGWNTLSTGTNTINLSGLDWSGPNFYYKAEFTSDGVDTPVLDQISIYYSTYFSSGNLISSAFDAGSDMAWDWGLFVFTLVEPASTNITFQIRSASTQVGLASAIWYGPTGTSDFYTTSGTAVNPVHDGDRWIQYRAYFSGPGISTPTLSDTSIDFTVFSVTYTVQVIGGSYSLVSDNTSQWESGWSTIPQFFFEVTPR